MNEQLAILGGPMTISPNEAKFNWPRITTDLEMAVTKQLHKSISIYDHSGILKEFEDDFSNYHERKMGLLFNSGTSAIYAMYKGIELGPGDEVICPTYTFFATVSPLMSTGARPIFCDCRMDGNIDPAEIIRKITPKTRAVMVTHMWGIPCDMDIIQNICLQNNLVLLEDCSHAHGASFNGKKVGTFGAAAAWSLQGQKIITGGEGGILLTDSDNIYYRALSLGHYNKRCHQEIPTDHPLSVFAQTGFGQKFRAHPLAIAIARQQFGHLDEWIKQKSIFAGNILDELKKCSFLSMPVCSGVQPSWYALVMLFNEKAAHGVKLGKFIETLHAEGLVEVDLPRSTGPIHGLPLFRSPEQVFPELYQYEPVEAAMFDNADKFYNTAIKIPVWAFSDDDAIVNAYIKGFKKVINVVENYPGCLY